MATKKRRTKAKTKSYVFMSAAELGQVEALTLGLEEVAHKQQLLNVGLQESLRLVERLHVNMVNELALIVDKLTLATCRPADGKHDSADPAITNESLQAVEHVARDIHAERVRDEERREGDQAGGVELADGSRAIEIVEDDQEDAEQWREVGRFDVEETRAAVGYDGPTGIKEVGSLPGSTSTSIGDTAGPGPTAKPRGKRSGKGTAKERRGNDPAVEVGG